MHLILTNCASCKISDREQEDKPLLWQFDW